MRYRRGAPRWLAAVVLVGVIGVVTGARLAGARVDPLAVVQRQVQKANMLVVLDTAGSMTGVPGSPFAADTEVGVDCDAGEDCRGWTGNSACSAAECAQVKGTGCPAGFVPEGPNLIQNADFSTATGSNAEMTLAAFNALYPSVRFRTGGTPAWAYGGDNRQARDTGVSIVRNVTRFAPTPAAGIDPDTGLPRSWHDQLAFPGDPCYEVPASPNFLYSNGNSMAPRPAPPWVVWEQDVSLERGAFYVFAAYVSNVINARWCSNVNSACTTSCPACTLSDVPIWTFKVDGAAINAPLTLPNEFDSDGIDRWQRIQYGFATAAGVGLQASTIQLWDAATGMSGDDAAITRISLMKCVPITVGACSATGEACGPAGACPPVSRCQATGEPCNNPGGACPAAGTCAGTAPALGCSTSSDCPTTAAGSCSIGGAACAGSCPPASACALSRTPCASNADCPAVSQNHCSGTVSRTCTGNADCPAGQTCLTLSQKDWCLGQAANVCSQPRAACNLLPNACQAVPNVCTKSRVTSCGGTKLGTRMCQTAQTMCRVNADCPPGDTCGMPTSRAVITRRVLQRVIEDTHTMVNFGFMTPWQDGYFPYFDAFSPVPAGTTSSEYLTRLKLASLGCYDPSSGPAATCVIDGRTFTRKAAAASRYHAQLPGGQTGYVDADFCGATCAVGGGAGQFLGATYTVPVTIKGSNSGAWRTMGAYRGREAVFGGQPFVYHVPNASAYNGGTPPSQLGFQFEDCDGTNACGARCGGRWDPALVPFLDVTGANATPTAVSISDRLRKTKFGGAAFYQGRPTGCVLENDGAPAVAGEQYGARGYMERVLAELQAREGLTAEQAKTCRPNYVLLVTDGAPNGPGDDGCGAAACSLAANPGLAGCACKAVLAANRLRTDLGVKTLVAAFGGDVAAGTARLALENLAQAGGTDAGGDGAPPFAYVATSEEELQRSLRSAVLEASRGSFQTAPPTTSASLQRTAGVQGGEYVLDVRVDFPSWEGHLIAYDVSGGSPVVAWDANTELKKVDWWLRRVYVGAPAAIAGPSGVVKIAVDPATRTVTNASQLASLGLGATAQEASTVARWLLGDPRTGRRAVLGAIVNSTPIDVGPPLVDTNFKGAAAFAQTHESRPSLTYVGSDDGMLHAFFTRTTAIAGVTYPGGSEAFAFVPQTRLAAVRKLFAQGGQVPEPDGHIFGIASSPKVRSICVSGCTDETTAVWKTVLAVGEGFGGNDLFALDITSPAGPTGISDPPVRQLWSTATVSQATRYDQTLGLTISVPALIYRASPTEDDFRLLMTSGYPVGAAAGQGRTLSEVSVRTGALEVERSLVNAANCAATFPGQDYAALTDVAVARDWMRGRDTYARLLSAYFGDTWGALWRYDAGGTVTKLGDLGCRQPLHFAPTVIQLDRDNTDPSVRGHVYVVQAVNSVLDPVTVGVAYDESRLLIVKDRVTFDDANSTFTVAQSALASGATAATIAASSICVAYAGGACAQRMPADARPAGTPTGVLRHDGQGFVLVSVWNRPSLTGCDAGTSYVAVHDVSAIGDVVAQRAGVTLADQLVMGTVVAAGKIWVATDQGLIEVGAALGMSFSAPGQAGGSGGGPAARFRRLAWTEIQ